MARIVVIGAGTIGLTAALLLRHEGHDVTVIERDAAPAPEPERAWDDWPRRGVAQFRLPHHYSARFARTVSTELPSLAARFVDDGALTWNPIDALPAAITGGRRAGDERFDVITGRRPFMEAVAASHAADLGIEIRRGASVSGLEHHLLADGTVDVTGVIVEDGTIHADLVVDATGRRSAMSTMLRSISGCGPIEIRRDAGYVYYARHYRSEQVMPPVRGPLLQPYGSISVATLPAERGTWSVVVFASSGDRAVAGLRRVDAWDRVVRACPLAAHWTDAEPITGVDVIASIEDRRCDYVVDGRLAAIGVVPIGDASASTSPSLGRGSSFGAMHAVVLRDVLREVPVTDRLGVAEAFHARTRQRIAPWIDDTTRWDQHRLGEMRAAARGEPYRTTDVDWYSSQRLARSAGTDPDLFRHQLDVTQALSRIGDVLAEPGVAERLSTLDARTALPGPDRDELIDLLDGARPAPAPDRPTELIAR